MAKGLALLLLLSPAASGQVDLFAFGSLGEAPYRIVSDVFSSTAVPQAGVQVGWRLKYGGPFAEASVGRYYAGGLYEGFLGFLGGVDLWRVRPSLFVGYAVQSGNRRDYEFESDAYVLVRETDFPFGLGMRLDLFDRGFLAWEARNRGIVMWRFTVGLRLARLANL